MNTLNERLRTARERAGYETISNAAKAFGWTYSTYAGHENGHRGTKPADIEKYAKAFGVTAQWLLSGGPSGDFPTTPHPAAGLQVQATGFAESTVAQYHPSSDTLRRKMIEVARAMSPTSNQITFYEIQRDQPSLMLLSGDVLIVDQKRTVATIGGIVIARMIDEQTRESHTVLRLQQPDGIIPAYGEKAPSSDEVEASVGVVICSIRPAALTP